MTLNEANSYMTMLVNRAGAYRKDKYSKIICNIEDNDKGFLTFNIAIILSAFYKTKFYTSLKANKSKCWVKNKVIKRRPKFWLYLLSKNKKTLNWNDIDIFLGYNDEQLTEISKLLYDIGDNNATDNHANS